MLRRDCKTIIYFPFLIQNQQNVLNKETTKRHPAFWIPTTWFAMGLPFVALAAASSLMYKNMGIPDSQIAFWTSLIMLPWTIKPLWGPFLEMYKTNFNRCIVWPGWNKSAPAQFF